MSGEPTLESLGGRKGGAAVGAREGRALRVVAAYTGGLARHRVVSMPLQFAISAQVCMFLFSHQPRRATCSHHYTVKASARQVDPGVNDNVRSECGG